MQNPIDVQRHVAVVGRCCVVSACVQQLRQFSADACDGHKFADNRSDRTQNCASKQNLQRSQVLEHLLGFTEGKDLDVMLQSDPRFVLLAVVDLLKVGCCLLSLATSTHLALWFFVILGEGPIVFLLRKLHRNQIKNEELRLSTYKLGGLALFGLSNFMLTVCLQSLTVQIAFGYLVLSSVEYFLLMSAFKPSPIVEQVCHKITGQQYTLLQQNTFDFRQDSTKLAFALTKLIVSSLGLLLTMFTTRVSSWSDFGYLLLLIVLTQYKDKFEKKIVSLYDPSKLHFAKSLVTPVLYLAFTYQMIVDQTIDIFILATLYQLSFSSFYYDESVLAIRGERVTEHLVLTKSGSVNFNIAATIFEHNSLWEFAITCWQKEDTRNMLIFLTLNMVFMVVELCYGVYSNSLGLISDAFHMFSDCFSLLVALFAAYVAMTKQADHLYTFGYQRAEVLSGLFNGVFLIFVAFNVFIESVERIYEPQEIQGSSLLLVSVLGLLVNIVGLLFFHEHAHRGNHEACSHSHKKPEPAPFKESEIELDVLVDVIQVCSEKPSEQANLLIPHQHSCSHHHDHSHGESHDHDHDHHSHSHSTQEHTHGANCSHPKATDHSHQEHTHGSNCSHRIQSHDHSSHDHSSHHHDENMYGVFLHILADTLGSVAVIISSLCIKYFDFPLADPICSFLISALILAAAIPFTMQTARVLTLGLHKDHHPKATQIIQKYLQITELKIWELAQGQHCLSCKGFGDIKLTATIVEELHEKLGINSDHITIEVNVAV